MLSQAILPLIVGIGFEGIVETQRHRCINHGRPDDCHIKLVKTRTLRNRHRLRGKRYRAGISRRNFHHKARGRGSADIQPDSDSARGKEGFASGSRKTDCALVGVHREDSSVVVQPPSRRKRLARRNTQSNGGSAARGQSGDSQRNASFTRTGRHIQRRFRVWPSLEQHIFGVLDGCSEMNSRRKRCIRALANRNILRVSRIKVEFVYTEPDGVCNERLVVCGNVNGESVILDKPFARETRPLAKPNGDRLLGFFSFIVFNGNRRSNLKDAAGDAGRRGDGETIGRGGCRVAIFIGSTVFTVGFRVGESKGDIAADVRVRKACAVRIPEPEPEGDFIALGHNHRSRFRKADAVLFVGENGESVGVVIVETETIDQASRQGDGDFLVGFGAGGSIVVDGRDIEGGAVLVRADGDDAIVRGDVFGTGRDPPGDGNVLPGRGGRDNACP